jgi:hypothetical protein
MKILATLEERVNLLVMLTRDLFQKNKDLIVSNELLKTKIEKLEIENAKFAEDNGQVLTQIPAIESSLTHENEQVHMLKEEKTLTKVVVDDLIKSIDALIERENQQ